MNAVFFDFETGGLDPKHPNIQLGAVALRDWQEVDAFEAKIAFDAATADPEALALNHYTPEAWANAKPEAQVAQEFERFLSRHAALKLISKRGKPYTTTRLAGHNVAGFDCERLKVMMDRHLMGQFWHGCWWYPFDTYPLAIWKRPDLPKYDLQTLAKALEIEVDGAAHEALSDVRLCVKIARALIHG